jgi:hypothetical protein
METLKHTELAGRPGKSTTAKHMYVQVVHGLATVLAVVYHNPITSGQSFDPDYLPNHGEQIIPKGVTTL